MNPSRGGRRQLPATPGSPPMGSPNGSSPRMDDFENYVVLRPLGDKDNTLLVARRDTSEECIMNIRSAMETSESDMAMFIQEVQLLALLDHRFVLPFVESFVAVDTVHLVTGRFTEDLGDHVRAQRKSREYIKDRAVAHWFTQMSLALDYIHSQNIIHRDFKLESVFLSDSGDVRVGGFGLAVTVASRDDTCDQYAGTPYYVAPEIIMRTPFTQKADVWALGVCLFKLLALVYPFAAADMKRLARSIVHTEHRELPGHVSRHMRELVDMMLQKRPADRPTPRTILRSQPRLGVRAYSFLPTEEFTPIFGADVYARLAKKEKKAAAAAELSSNLENTDRTAGSESIKSIVESYSMIDFNGIGSVTASPPSGTSGQSPLSSSPARPPLHTTGGGKRQISRGTMDDMLSHVRPVRSSMVAKEPDPSIPATAVSTTSSHSHHGGDGASGSGGVRRPRAMSGSSARSGNSGVFGALSNIGSSGQDSVEDEGGLFNTTLSRLDSLMVATTNESRANRSRTKSSESRAARRRRNEAARAAERASESTADDDRGHEMNHLQSPDRHHGRRGRDNPRRSGSRSPVSDRVDAADPNPVLPVVVPAALSSGGGSHSTSGVSGRSGRSGLSCPSSRSGLSGLSGLSGRSSARSLRSSLERAQEGTHGTKKKDKKAKGKKHKKKHKKNKKKSKRSREDAAEAAIANAFGGPP